MIIRHSGHMISKLKPFITTNQSSIFRISDEHINKTYYNKTNFLNEVNILESLDHPQIISIYKHYKDTYNKGIIEFKYYKDGDLLSFINTHVRQSNSSFTTSDKITMFKHIITPLLYCHENNIVHSDIKPQNIMLYKNIPILIDFGISVYDHTFSNHIEKNNVIRKIKVGTPEYIAPEVKDNLIGPCSDVYSLGIVLYQLFTSEYPIMCNDTVEILNSTIEKYDIPINIQNVLKDMLEDDYRLRPTLNDIQLYYDL